MYAQLSDAQTQYLRKIVKGKVVADLGCGDGVLTRLLARWGTSFVHGVDKELPPSRRTKKIRWHTSYFAYWTLPTDTDIAVVSWPRNGGILGLVELTRAAREVIYIGKNTDWIACGTPALMGTLQQREALQYIPDRGNVLIHYGPGPRSTPHLYHEEFAGMFEGPDAPAYNPDLDMRPCDEWRGRSQEA